MKLTQTGTIKVDGYSVRRTKEGDWHVSRFETSLGYVDSLDEVDGLIARHKEKVRARLAMAQRKAEERKAETLRCMDCDCNRIATYQVQVPWTHLDTGEKGAEWTPVCRAHYPNAEQWPTVMIGV